MTYTKTLVPLLAALLVAVFAVPAFAHNGVDHGTEAEASAHVQAGTNTLARPLDFLKGRAREIQNNVQNTRIELRTDIRADMRATSTTAHRRGVHDAMHWHGGLIRERFVVAFRQFERIIARIESRLEKLEAQGVVTASAEAELEIAKIAVAKAKVDGQAVADFVAQVDDPASRQTVKTELQAKIRTAHASLKAAHQALMKTARALKALTPKINVEATTTTSVEVNE